MRGCSRAKVITRTTPTCPGSSMRYSCGRRMRMPGSRRSTPPRPHPRPACTRSTPVPITRPTGSRRQRRRCRAKRLTGRRCSRPNGRHWSSVASTADAALPDAPRVWDENPDNIAHTYERGDKAKTEAAFARARHIVRRRYVISRVHAQYMEPRGAIGTYDPGEDRYTLYADVNYPHRVRNMLANMVFKVPESKVRVVCHDVGGGFGAKGWQYVEHRLTLWAAKKLGRALKWSCERSEVILADEHGRDNIGKIELAFDDNAKILALRLHMIANVGAYIASDRQLLTPFGMIGTVVGVYDIPAAYVSIDAVLSNTSPTAPYRGAGRPEAIYLIERAIETSARELNLD